MWCSSKSRNKTVMSVDGIDDGRVAGKNACYKSGLLPRITHTHAAAPTPVRQTTYGSRSQRIIRGSVKLECWQICIQIACSSYQQANGKRKEMLVTTRWRRRRCVATFIKFALIKISSNLSRIIPITKMKRRPLAHEVKL